MDNIKNISVPQACHRSWQQMNEVNYGRYCEHCCKKVVDFTTMTNNEIITHLSTKTNVCGRFDQLQLNNVNHWLYIKNLSATNWWKRIAVIVGLFGSFPLFKATGQIKPTIVSTADTTENRSKSDHFILGKIAAVPNSTKYRIIKGNVIASDDRLPLPGASVKLKGNNIGTQCDVNGNFILKIPADSTSAMLQFSFVGFTTQEISLKNDLRDRFDVVLAPPLTNNLVTVGMVIIKRASLPQRIWYRIKRVF
jgi:carboxypeptidase-like protein